LSFGASTARYLTQSNPIPSIPPMAHALKPETIVHAIIPIYRETKTVLRDSIG
jgi:hypothetical protein